ncbi:MAG: transglycosylase SLT domain-containing protein [Alphaproteobacteria bacterium]
MSTAILSIILLPVQAAEYVPVPMAKPAMLGGAPVPLPLSKPAVKSPDQIEKDKTGTFKGVGLKLASLFSGSKTKAAKVREIYPHGYRPLSAEQTKLYNRIFDLQARGQMDKAQELIRTLKDDRLMGHVLQQRYMHTSYKSSFEELKGWLDVYTDHPKAHDLYKLAISRNAGTSLNDIVQPKTRRLLSQVKEPTIYYPKHYKSTIKRSSEQEENVKALFKKVQSYIRKGKRVEALKEFRDASERAYMDNVEHDRLQTKIAAAFLYSKRLESAYKLASQSADRSGKYVPEANWIAGLSLWQLGRYDQAAAYFTNAGKSKYASGWLASAGAYWAARSYKKLDRMKEANAAYDKAAKHSRTFYGLLAVKALGRKHDFDWDTPEYSREDEALILAHNGGKRAFLLVGAGQYAMAESELMRLDYAGNNGLRRSVLAYASHVGLPGIASRLSGVVKRSGKGKSAKYYDSAIYPVSPWTPKGGYKIDPALVHAVMRQESRFNLQAKSYSGAIGLMQIMPDTAGYVAKREKYDQNITPVTLRVPEVNMMVGQDYLDYLLKTKYIKGDVVSLLISYNAGPGNLLKWRKRMGSDKDPLLFIETLPVAETRDYVERVMSNYWIYRLRAGLDLPSLTSLSNGRKPQYAHVMQAQYPYKLASN